MKAFVAGDAEAGERSEWNTAHGVSDCGYYGEQAALPSMGVT